MNGSAKAMHKTGWISYYSLNEVSERIEMRNSFLKQTVSLLRGCRAYESATVYYILRIFLSSSSWLLLLLYALHYVFYYLNASELLLQNRALTVTK